MPFIVLIYIISSILPVKTKLLGKLSCLQEQSSSLEIPVDIVNDIANNPIKTAVPSISSTSSSTTSSPPTASVFSLPLSDPYAVNSDTYSMSTVASGNMFDSQFINSQLFNSQASIVDQHQSLDATIASSFDTKGVATYTTSGNISVINNPYGNSNSNSSSSSSSSSNHINNNKTSTSDTTGSNHSNKRKFDGKNRDQSHATEDRVVLNGVKNEETLGQNDEYMSSRRRRRLSQIVPNPRKPRQADYMCSVCNECYTFTVLENPWWAVYEHECPRCQAIQIPRIDINIQSNAIELDPNVVALYGEGVDDSGDENCDNEEEEEEVEEPREKEATSTVAVSHEADLPQDTNLFDGEGLLKAEEASKLLVLMCHARTCTGDHSLPKHSEICKSTKFLMLHIRDCDGTDVHGRECQFPWCSPCKRMLVHLTRCLDPKNCKVCNPWTLSQCYQQLHYLNKVRLFDEPQGSNSSVNPLNQSSSKIHM